MEVGKCPVPCRAGMGGPKSPGVQLGTALSHSLLVHLSQTPLVSCWLLSWLYYYSRRDEHRALPSPAVPSLLCTRERCFWSSALHGDMEQERVLVAVVAPSIVSMGPWEYLLKIRLECVFTTLTHSVIFRK